MKPRKHLARFSGFLSAGLLPLCLAANNGEARPLDTASPRHIEGTWEVRPLLRYNDPLPETGGTLQEVAEVWWLETGHAVFLGRFGQVVKTKFRVKENPWALCSVGTDGVVRTVLRSGAPFAKAGAKDLLIRFYGPTERDDAAASTAQFHAGRRMLYWSASPKLLGPAIIYGWDGDKILRVVGAGDRIVSSANREVVIGDVRINSVTNDQRLFLRILEPKRPDGHALYDGTTLTACWMDGDAVPGIPGALVNGIRAAPACFGDASLVSWMLKGAKHADGLYCMKNDRAEKLILQGEPNPAVPGKKTGYIERYHPAGPAHFLIQPGDGTLLAYVAGKWLKLIGDVRDLPDHEGYDSYEVDGVALLGADRRNALLSISLLKTESYPGGMSGPLYVDGGKQTLKRLPGLFFFDGERLTPVPFKPTGKQLAEFAAKQPVGVKRALAGVSHFVITPIKVRSASGLPGALVEVPVFGAVASILGGPSERYFDPDSKSGDLETPPAFATDAAYRFTAADIIGWHDPDRVLVKNSKGFFELNRQK